MKNAKYLTFIPLVLWIIFWTVIVAVIVYFTHLNVLFVLLFIPVFCFFDLIWWVLVMNDKLALDRFTIFSFLIVLNFPAYWLAKKSREFTINEEIQKRNIKGIIYPELDQDYDLLPDWEKEIIEIKKTKNQIKKKNKTAQYLEDPKFELQRLILNSYNQFLLYQVWNLHPEITQTYDLNQTVKKHVFDQNLSQKSIFDFIQNYQIWLVVDWENFPELKNDQKNYLTLFLTQTSPEEIMVAYKQNRIDNTIKVKKMLQKEKEKGQ